MHRYLRSKPGKKELRIQDIVQGKTPSRALLRFAQHAGIASDRPHRFGKARSAKSKKVGD
jgi:hypothetical protein